MNEAEKIVFTDPDVAKEWDALAKHEKDFIMNNLAECMDKSTNKVAIEILCSVVNELIDRIEKLEKNQDNINLGNPRIHITESPTPCLISWNWVSVKDRLPEYSYRVLVTDGIDVLMAEYDYMWCGLNVVHNAITHWMCLPALPKDEK